LRISTEATNESLKKEAEGVVSWQERAWEVIKSEAWMDGEG